MDCFVASRLAMTTWNISWVIQDDIAFDPPIPSCRRRPASTTKTIHGSYFEEKTWMPAYAGMTM